MTVLTVSVGVEKYLTNIHKKLVLPQHHAIRPGWASAKCTNQEAPGNWALGSASLQF